MHKAQGGVREVEAGVERTAAAATRRLASGPAPGHAPAGPIRKRAIRERVRLGERQRLEHGGRRGSTCGRRRVVLVQHSGGEEDHGGRGDEGCSGVHGRGVKGRRCGWRARGTAGFCARQDAGKTPPPAPQHNGDFYEIDL